MLRGVSFLVASAAAVFAAGPIAGLFYLWLLLATGDPALLSASELGAGDVFAIGAGVWLVVSIVAVLPVAVGTAAMGLLGSRFAWARSYIAWGMTGLVFAGLPAAAIAILAGDVTTLALTVAITGAGCALVSRRFIRWSEPAPQA